MSSLITITPDSVDDRGFVATHGSLKSTGTTFGEALDHIREAIGGPRQRTVVILDPFQPDEFFTAAQIQRMNELMAQSRAARANGEKLPDDVRSELEALIETEVRAAGERARFQAEQHAS